MEQPATAIRLDTDGECPHCGRPILGLAHDQCSGCGLSLEEVFESLPSVASRLNEIAPGWTVQRLKAWASIRPAQIAWAYQSRHWRNLGWWAETSLWEGWARLEMSLRGRGRALHLEQVKVDRVQIAGLDGSKPFVNIRVEGTRIAFLYEPDSGRLLSGLDTPRPFKELWTLQAMDCVWPSELPPCHNCGAGLPFEENLCPHCHTPVQPTLGSWSVIRVLPVNPSPGPVVAGPGEGALDGVLRLFLEAP